MTVNKKKRKKTNKHAKVDKTYSRDERGGKGK